jgi:hypothetical protein
MEAINFNRLVESRALAEYAANRLGVVGVPA